MWLAPDYVRFSTVLAAVSCHFPNVPHARVWPPPQTDSERLESRAGTPRPPPTPHTLSPPPRLHAQIFLGTPQILTLRSFRAGERPPLLIPGTSRVPLVLLHVHLGRGSGLWGRRAGPLQRAVGGAKERQGLCLFAQLPANALHHWLLWGSPGYSSLHSTKYL